MSQNRSSAVMNQRTEAHDSLDDFPTPCWSTRSILRHLTKIVPETMEMAQHLVAREPCANRGYMVKPLAEVFGTVEGTDILDYGVGFDQLDYLFPGPMIPAQVTVMNPPFKLAEQFIHRSFSTPGWRITATLVRTNFLEGSGRYRRLYSSRPPTFVAHHVERVVMVKGRMLDPDVDYFDGKGWRKPSTATCYTWMVWIKDMEPLPTQWLAYGRRDMSRPGDYPALTNEMPPITLEGALNRSLI